MKSGSRFTASFVFVLLCLSHLAHAQILFSWEGSLEGWTPRSGITLDNTLGGPNQGLGVTDGSDSLQVTLPSDGWQRWGESGNLTGQALTDIQTAAEKPLIHRIEFDVTYDTSLIPQGSVSFINQQIAINTDSGWSQQDIGTEVTDGMTSETLHIARPLSRFTTLTPTSSPVNILVAINGDWGAAPATVFYDSLQISEIVPDLDENMVVEPLDWDIFVGAHLTDISDLSYSQRFLKGDLDSDGDNDFDDFVIFEAGYDEANGLGAFARDIGSIPEPSTWALCALGGLVLFGARRRRAVIRTAVPVILVLTTLLCATSSQAQVLNSWETGLENWSVTGFSNPPTTIATSTSFPTDGTQSLAVTNSEDGFFWSTFVNYGSSTPQFDALASAVDVGIDHYALDFDVTFDTNSFPAGVTSGKISVALNSSGGWIQYGDVVVWDGLTTETAHVSIPLDQSIFPPTSGTGMLAPGSATSFYQVNFGLDGEWGLSDATFYFDKLDLVQVSTPAMLTLEVDRSNGITKIKNENTSGMIDFNYYIVTSVPGNSLDDIDWFSLEEQGNGDWREAAGSSTSQLAELNLFGSSALGADQELTLGEAYNHLINAEDLVFRYQDLDRPGLLSTANVVYINDPPMIAGDFNMDGNWDCADINALVAAIATASTDLSFDMNGDGVINVNDITDAGNGWLAVGGANNPDQTGGNPFLVGDATLDGVVDGLDFIEWNDNKFTSLAEWCGGDFTADGVVDGLDFIEWNANKFMSSDHVAVPEPSAAVLGMISLLGLFFCRRGTV